MDRSMIRIILCLTLLCVSRKASGSTFVCTRALDISIAVDVSGSLANNISQIQTFLNDLVGQFTISNSAARIVVFGFDHNATFANVTSLDQAGAQTLAGVREQISSIRPTLGATLITVAIAEAVGIFSDSTARNAERVAVFVTDGVNQGGSETITQPAKELRANFNARVIGLGVAPTPDIPVFVDAFNLLTGNPNNLLILTFEKKRCPTGGGGGGGESDDDDEDDDDESSSDSENEGGAACDDELSRAARLICG